MISGLDTPPNPAASNLIHPATDNPAVALCCKAYARAYKEAAAAGKDHILAIIAAAAAYRNALPPLDGPESIRDFVACVAHAMLVGALQTSDGARLLYAAQVASGILPRLLPPTAESDRKPAAKPKTALRKPASSASGQPADPPSPALVTGQEAVA